MTPLLTQVAEGVTAERFQELEAEASNHKAQISHLQDLLQQADAGCQAKNVQFEGELRNRSNIAVMQGRSTERMEADDIKELMTEISPFKMPQASTASLD
jgi:hypothetical protein